MRWRTSIKRRITVLIGAVILLLATSIIAYNAYNIHMSRERVDHSLLSTLMIYSEELDLKTENIEEFLLEQCVSTENIQKITYPRQEVDRYLAILKLREQFATAISNYEALESVFLYDEAHNIFVSQSKRGKGETIERNIRNFTEGFRHMRQEKVNQWFSVKAEEEYYLTKMYRTQGIYVGACIGIEEIVEKTKEVTLNETDRVALCDYKGVILDNSIKEEICLNGERNVTIEGRKYRNLQAFSSKNNFSLAILEAEDGIGGIQDKVMNQIVFLVIFVIAFSIVSLIWLHRFLSEPINDLVGAMNKLKEGNLDAAMENRKTPVEFKIVDETFREMTHEIKRLKIDVYEGMLQKQKVELLYLQEQINPHFLTNCMNLLRNLSIMGENEKIEEASILISKYMRYTLSNSTLIPITREIEHVENYVKLQKMRFGDEFQVDFKMKESDKKYLIPTMLIQTFVDNAIKHQMEPGRLLKIQVQIEHQEEMKALRVRISDNGDGFDEEVLETLNQHKKLVNEMGEHIGIFNVYQRLEILYGKRAGIIFYNSMEGGAVVDMVFPQDIEVPLELDEE